MPTHPARLPLRAAARLTLAAALLSPASPLPARADDARPGPAARAPAIAAVWANDGGDKVTRDELRAARGGRGVRNRTWDGRTVRLAGARNEIVAFNLVLEAPVATARDVQVTLDRLDGPGGAAIRSQRVAGDGVFDWPGRDIELFYVRYLQIRGLSKMSYEGSYYDERHAPARLRRPNGTGGWTDRPDHDKYYPDIAVPLDLVPRFAIPRGTNQSVWVDVYVPRGAAPGVYRGTVRVTEAGQPPRALPVELTVHDFALPDTPSAKTMLYVGRDIAARYIGPTSPPGDLELVRDRHFQLAHRHRISAIGDDVANATQPYPSAEWLPRLDGRLFTAARGYAGPGVGVGTGVYSIGTYGGATLPWMRDERTARGQADAWARWFLRNSPGTEYFLYLVDESHDYPAIERWASWFRRNPGLGGRVRTFATIDLLAAAEHTPSLDIAASSFATGVAEKWEAAVRTWRSRPGRRFYLYNSRRPANGSFATEDDGVALRELAWVQYKMRVDRWFYWESTYYRDYQGGRGETDVFETAATFSGALRRDPVNGETGYNHTNGDGVLFYPGTDRIYPKQSYNVRGPLASLRLKHWRRGIQDVDYLTMASRVDSARVGRIVARMVPKALWEYGVDTPSDPTYVHADISWSIDPDDWEAARAELAAIIAGGRAR